MKLLWFLKWFVYLVCKLNACINVSVWSKDNYNKTPAKFFFHIPSSCPETATEGVL